MVATNSSKNVVYLINKYVFELLRLNHGWKIEDYGGKTPIIPSNMEPEFTAYDKPFIVYGYSEDTTSDLYELRSGSLSYAVWSNSSTQIDSILTTIKVALERHDESARDVTVWTERTGSNPAGTGFRFDDIYIGYYEGPSPEETEGGRQAGIITIRYNYTASYSVTLPS